MAADERTVREHKRADSLAAVHGIGLGAALRIARAEIEREGRLVDFIRINVAETFFRASDSLKDEAHRVVAAWEAEFEPPKRTLAEVARDVVTNQTAQKVGPLPFELLDELAAALAREKGGE